MYPGTRPQLLRTVAALIVPLVLVSPALAGKKLVRLHFSGPVLEAPVGEMDLNLLMGGEKSRSLREWTRLIEKAAADAEIAGAMMIVDEPAAGLAQVEELRRALDAFRASGKKIHAFMDYGGNLSYALAAGADDITLAENSGLDVVGLFAEMSFYKGTLDKLGIEADMMHCGDYKTALEPYTRTEPSKENAEMVNWLLDGMYDRWIGLIASGRKLSVDATKAAVDQAPFDAKKALALKLVDHVDSYHAFTRRLKDAYGADLEVVKKYDAGDKLKIDFNNPFAIFQLFNDALAKSGEPEEQGIGLIYIDGPIMTGKNQQSLLGGSTAGSTTIRAALEKARESDHIKAVVLRVNSPGGSALASDIMWEAATRLGKEKPLVVSMGNVAGSGGYYVAIPGETIFAEETTLTGSIGVVMGKMITRGLWEEKCGITTSEFKRGQNADIMSMNRKWDDRQRAQMIEYMNSIYTQFKARVTASRGDRLKGDLESLAGGRVYTGKQALERGLVDRIGGLGDAIRYAAGKVGMAEKDVKVYVLPKPEEFADVVKKLMGEETEDEWEVSMLRGFGANSPLLGLLPLIGDLAPQALQKFGPGLQSLLILHQERIGCFMPFHLHVR